jgi:hypothetical protein
MKLKELIEKQELTTDESLFIIQQYVKIRKGLDITPAILADNELQFMREIHLMNYLLQHAILWLKQNHDLTDC